MSSDHQSISQPHNSIQTSSGITKRVSLEPERMRPADPECQSITFGALFQLYLNHYATNHTKTWRDLIENYNRYFRVWTDRKCSSIKKREIQYWVDELAPVKGKHCANRSHDTMRAILNRGIKKEYIVGPKYRVTSDPAKTDLRILAQASSLIDANKT